jgi:hypothetical protein
VGGISSPASREDLMTVLADVEAMLVKATVKEDGRKSSIR